MPNADQTPRRRASLELLRAEASDELAVVIAERLRAGEDPWDFMDDLPTVDELVVFTLRAENIEANDDGTEVKLGFAEWQTIQAVQMLLARYGRMVAEPEHT